MSVRPRATRGCECHTLSAVMPALTMMMSGSTHETQPTGCEKTLRPAVKRSAVAASPTANQAIRRAKAALGRYSGFTHPPLDLSRHETRAIFEFEFGLKPAKIK